MREFNIFGPVYPEYHYHVNRVESKAIMREKVERGRYFTLNAGRQTGKTTLFREIVEELEATGNYVGIRLNFEILTNLTRERTYEVLGYELNDWRKDFWPSAPEPSTMQDQHHFIQWLKNVSRVIDKRVVLIIDEFEAVPIEITAGLLSQFRGMYLQRLEPGSDSVYSIILVGVRSVAHLLGGSQSPFNIADQYTVPYFSKEEVIDLLSQHTEATGQPFEGIVFDSVFAQSEGQPFLVNRLGQLLTETYATDRSQPITKKHFDQALNKLINENNTNFYSIRSKAKLHKDLLLDALFRSRKYYDYQDEVMQEFLMYGIMRLIPDEYGSEYARIANPIYQKLLVKTFAPSHSLIRQVPITELQVYHRFMVEDILDTDSLMDSFKDFMEEHGVRLLKSEATHNPLEISGQYMLLSYLTAVLSSIDGYATVESLSVAGEMDIVGFHRGQRFIIETKIWYGKAKYEQGLTQLSNYLRAAGLQKGYMVIFDHKKDNNVLLQENADVFELTLDDKTMRVYLIGVTI
ncbi:MAG: AAA-like domain-containing protein [Chloroflexota bacterium]